MVRLATRVCYAVCTNKGPGLLRRLCRELVGSDGHLRYRHTINLCGMGRWSPGSICQRVGTTSHVHSDGKLTHLRFWEINYIDVYDAPIPAQPTSASNMTVTSSTGVYANQSTVTSTTAVPTSTPTGSLTRDPASIGDFILLGCFGSNSSFATFNPAGNDAAMTPEVCVSLCSANKYAGVFDR